MRNILIVILILFYSESVFSTDFSFVEINYMNGINKVSEDQGVSWKIQKNRFDYVILKRLGKPSRKTFDNGINWKRVSQSTNVVKYTTLHNETKLSYDNGITWIFEEKNEIDQKLKITPNPSLSNGIVKIGFLKGNNEIVVQISSLKGSILFTEMFYINNFDNSIKLTIPELKSGSYFIILLGDKTSQRGILQVNN